MLKYLFCGVMLLSMMSMNALQADSAYANFYSTSPQTVPSGSAIAFENHNEVKNFDIVNSNQDIVFRKSGVYLIEYNVTCIPVNATVFSIGLYKNGTLVNGSVFGVGDASHEDVVDISGGVIISANWGDLLEVRNITSLGTVPTLTVDAFVSGNSDVNNASASIRLLLIHHKHSD